MKKRWIPILLFSAAALNAGTPSGGTPKITVLVYNSVPAAEKHLRHAIGQARGIFNRVGIRSEWRISDFSEDSNTYTLRIQVCRGSSTLPEFRGAGGVAMLNGGESSRAVDIFYGVWELIETQVDGLVDMPTLLAHVMAHEIGHLFGLAHARGSIMTSHWTRQELNWMSVGHLRFDREQAQELRAAAARRELMARAH